MKFIRFCMLLTFLFYKSASLFSQKINVIKYENLEKAIKKKNDTTYIVNFFASWCAPCLKELPEILAFAKAHETEKVKVLLVSLDFKKDYKNSLLPIIERYNIQQTIFLLDESNPNNWINKIDKTWSGAIPATYFINHAKKRKKLVAQSLYLQELNALLQ